MRQVNVVFLAIVVGAVLVGGVTATSFGTQLQTIDAITVVRDQIDTTATDVRVADQEFSVTVRLTNPTGYPIRLRGTFVRVYGQDDSQLAFGAGERVDGGPGSIPARGELTATYVVGLEPAQADRLRSAVEAGPVRLSLHHSLSLRDEPFDLVETNVTVSGEVAT